MLDFRTDMADERVKEYEKEGKIEGISSENIDISEKIKVTKVKVLNENGKEKIGKDIGTYITVEIKEIEIVNKDELEKISNIVSKELSELIKPYKSILVVGLGNIDTTVDSIGPKVIKDLKITRHLKKYAPDLIDEKERELSGIAPGVLGTTGMETGEILKGIVEKVKPDVIIAIDALISRDISRLFKTIQISDTGIVPGAGVGNNRKEISKKTMGIPVIAIGVPTLVEAATIVADSIELIASKFEEFKELKNATKEEKYRLMKAVLEPSKYNLTVTPKEVDDLVENMKIIIAHGINDSIK
mgnify:CR=1 FL=1